MGDAPSKDRRPQPKEYSSALERLRVLPEVFSGTDVNMAFGWTSVVSSTYLANWRRKGLVKSLGGRADVHMNLLISPNVDVDLALRRLYPSAARVGLDMLREGGWFTQIPSRPEIVIPFGEPLYALDDFTLATRAAAWFRQVAPGLVRTDRGVARLRPAWALADMLARAADRRVREAGLLDPEDLDLSRAAADPDMPAALDAFKLGQAIVTPEGYEDFLAQLNRQGPAEDWAMAQR